MLTAGSRSAPPPPSQVIAHRKISAATASLGEIRWKEDCEKQMSKLEADIKRLSVAGPIYVVSNHQGYDA